MLAQQRTRLILAFTACLLIGLVLQPFRNVAAQSATPKIVFVSTRDSNQEIYVMDADGSNPTNLTNDKGDDFTPSWSPDGKQILFVSNRDGNKEIYAMAADGSEPTNLTNNDAEDFAPSWSPDGKQILFVSTRAKTAHIFVMKSDGSKPAQLTKTGPATAPHWSPDGKYISFVMMGAGSKINIGTAGIVLSGSSAGINIMNANGSSLRRLSKEHFFFTGPVWSPDSKQIALLTISKQISGFLVFGANGAKGNELKVEFVPWNPSWSPDGKHIVYGVKQLYILDVQANTKKTLLNKTFTFNMITAALGGIDSKAIYDIVGVPSAPVWSPDSKQILFTNQELSDFEIYLVNADGTGLKNLTNNPAQDMDAVFQPVAAAQ